MLTKLLVLQPLDLCNLNCSYCYLPGRRNTKRMPHHILAASLKLIFNRPFSEDPRRHEKLKILWHSGEPLLAGIPFFKTALKLIQQYNVHHIPVSMEFQTNATPITQAWCDFIKENHLNVSVSIDGPEFLHNRYRINWQGKGSFKLVMRGIHHLQKNNLPLRAICVLTKDSLDYPDEIYDFFTKTGFESVCFNVEEQEGIHTHSTMSLREQAPSSDIRSKYQSFMSIFYDRWARDDFQLHIREFSHIFGNLLFQKQMGATTGLISAESLAFNILTITKDGDISTFSPELSGGSKTNPKQFIIGNVLDITSLDELKMQPNFLSQLHDIKQGVEKCAKECDYFNLCGGGSASNKFFENSDFNTTETSVCILSKKILTDLIIHKLQENRLP
ncbi:MAG: hypothetical protein A3E85_03285 [Gammaproteobacteria bacterium RIFCSPHIGHO2_12_FULL_45_12]|nr:MAG: hypothetical protein A3E85_03285 [Gammaproteobacteria bacterium RIFCSPHIGHO2_12_FULL_45_12]